ncbi:TRAP transporter permease [Halobium salinum]|uniref:TRAP transporter permease n=1 Tax=Halobium salinum TaxID=1364940 RepID=A0ABD5PG05_9EURY|nr:TRAP transporter permease [Halobium salinum]
MTTDDTSPGEDETEVEDGTPDGGTAAPDEGQLSEEEKQELIQELERKRSLRGPLAVVVSLIAVAFSAYQMWLAARGFIFRFELFGTTINLGALQLLQVNAIHVGFALVLTFLLFPVSDGEGFVTRRLASASGVGESITRGLTSRERVSAVDWALILLTTLATVYFITDFGEIQNRIRVLGFGATRTVGEVIPPLGVLPVIGDTSYAYVLGVVGVLLVLEATRRALGVYLMGIVASFIVYARYAYLIPDDVPYLSILATNQLRWGAIIQNLWYNTENGVFGIPVTVSVQFIYIFILFGAFLEMSGAGQWFIDLAYALTGSRKGGPAKASILSSGFMGTISGSSIANTVTTGAFTIPLMKKSGYDAEFAGGVEASASSGGQILPPVMGAAAFLIVEFTLTPYSDVIMAAAIPAVVFFFGVWVMVHLEASRAGIGGVDPSELIPLRPHMKRGWFYLAPLALLLFYLIVERLSVARSAWYTIVAIAALIALVAAYDRSTRGPLLGGIAAIFLAEVAAFALTGADLVGALTGAGGEALGVVGAVEAAAGSLGTIIVLVSLAVMLWRPDADSPLLDYDGQVDDTAETTAEAVGRPDLRNNKAWTFGSFVLKSMDAGARTATVVVVAVAAAGIIPGVISVTGLGPNLTSLIAAIAGESLVLLLLITAVSCIILGMGMPTTVTYIILVSMLGPSFVEVSGGTIPILAAHLFILYFGVIADITPPVAVAAYAASGVAKSDPFETGIKAFSLSLNKAIVPFAFVLSPGILLIRGVGTGEEAHVITFADVMDLGWFVPEVVVPVICLFLGVTALGPTIIGYLFASVSRLERTLFAVSSVFLMAPGLVFNPVLTVLELVGVAMEATLMLDLTLRAVGLVIFAALVAKNRSDADRSTSAPRAEPSD